MTEWIFETFSEYGSQPALIWQDQEFSFADLLAGADRWRQELLKHEIQPGDAVALKGDWSPNTAMLLLALIQNRNIAVPLAARIGEKQDTYLRIARATALFDFALDDTWRFSRHASKEPDHPLLAQLRSEQKPGLVVFSSGSTGEPKGILHDFERVLERFRPSGRAWRSLVFLLLDHLGGINTFFHLLRNGGTVVCVTDRSAEAICNAIERHRIQVLPTSPTFLNMLLISEMHKKHDLSSLELVTYGTEPMPMATLQRLNECFPNVRHKQTYGLSELGVFPTKSEGSESLRMKVGGTDAPTKIVDGVLWVRSKWAMLGYLNAPSPFDDEGWFNTEDRVEVHGDFIRVLGRASDLINVGGEKVFPTEVESVLLQMDNVKDVTVHGKANPVTGQVVAATVTLRGDEDPDAFKKRMREFCERRLARFRIPVAVRISAAQAPSARFKKQRQL